MSRREAETESQEKGIDKVGLNTFLTNPSVNMGLQLADQYSLLHFATGIIAYFWGISFWQWFFVHALFEITENTPFGIRVINMFSYWPGGKPYADALINIIGDHFFAQIGWVCAYELDMIGSKQKWYVKHPV